MEGSWEYVMVKTPVAQLINVPCVYATDTVRDLLQRIAIYEGIEPLYLSLSSSNGFHQYEPHEKLSETIKLEDTIMLNYKLVKAGQKEAQPFDLTVKTLRIQFTLQVDSNDTLGTSYCYFFPIEFH